MAQRNSKKNERGRRGPLRRSPLHRESNQRNQRSLFLVSTEGQTERMYLGMNVFTEMQGVTIRFPLNNGASHHKTNPSHVVKRAKELEKKHAGKSRLLEGDQVWVVVDTDSWSRADKDALQNFVEHHESYRHVAVSNPKFELFLLMHFEDSKGCTTAAIVDEHLKRCWPDYKKSVPSSKFSRADVREACNRAEAKRRSSKTDEPAEGCTDFYKLVNALFETEATYIATHEQGK